MSKLIRAGGPMKRLKLQFEPVQPPTGPVTPGPLIRAGGPLKRLTMTMEPARLTYLELTLRAGSDPLAVLAAVQAILATMENVRLDGTRSWAMPGQVKLALIPKDDVEPVKQLAKCSRAIDGVEAAHVLPQIAA